MLKDKVALVTGASSGMGKACAEKLAAAGAHVILAARRTDRIVELAEKLSETHTINAYPLTLDVSDYQSTQAALTHLPEALSKIDILINNAGCALGLDPLSEGDMADWNTMIDTNIKGVLHVTRSVLPGMLARNQGHIINIGSTSSHNTYVGGAVYCASKSAVATLSQTLALETINTGVRVCEIDPGMVETEFSVVRMRGDQAKADRIYADFEALHGEDIADTVMYVLTRPAHVNISQIILYSREQVERLPC